MKTINKNSVSLAGEFAVLSQLALRGYDANMTLGHTKSVDILVSDPKKKKMYQLEVKTNFKNSRNKPSVSKVHWKAVSGWIMKKEHESINIPTLFYCFVNISRDTNNFKFYIVPSRVVAKYVKDQHDLWIREKKKESKEVKDGDMRIFRIGVDGEKYPILTPTAKRYEDNWDFRSK
ncbi:MAG: hypothetical protein A3B11_00860 [Candidatus Taylorbacteria bacterium RIFCSPLOWO2_01_FULL_44_26]|nr:MAG: hypothetical protein A3B11_00860 [Candidatus Taylorbacteria bacterium RIFCSPLOWO2_01_FULL_44_26]